jgi:hypothetical protein
MSVRGGRAPGLHELIFARARERLNEINESLLHHDPQDGFVLDADVQEIEPATEGVGWMILAIPRDPEDPRAGRLRSSSELRRR